MAQYVVWSTPEVPSDRVTALFVDVPGGPFDRMAADPDVTTFLNDRFHPILMAPDQAPVDLGISFIDPRGCLMAHSTQPTSAQQWIQAANHVQLDFAAGRTAAKTVAPKRTVGPEGSPLRLLCLGSE